MESSRVISFPAQMLPNARKTKEWRKQCVDWAEARSYYRYSPVRKSVLHKKINYDLMNGKLHMDDLRKLINPDGSKLKADCPDNIQHYPIMKSKINLLIGEEGRRVFDYRVMITNPNAISEIERNKAQSIRESFQQWLDMTGQTQQAHQQMPQPTPEEQQAMQQNPQLAQQYEQQTAQMQQEQAEQQQRLDEISEYYQYEWQDMREIRANCFLRHYSKEQNFTLLFNQGFYDALTVGEEIYQCEIVSGEPIMHRLNPMKVSVYMSGYSDKIEDADIIVLEDYWSVGKIHDYFWSALSDKDRKYLEEQPLSFGSNSGYRKDEVDERFGLINPIFVGDEGIAINDEFNQILGTYSDSNSNPFDAAGNVRVLRVYWKSRRKIIKVTSYDEITGEEVINFYPEGHKIDKWKGETEESFWVNEAWEGTKIGTEIYVNIRPCQMQYNTLSNPSRCHFGIVGSIYNFNEDRPFSMVDMMKPYNYMYDIVHDRLNRMMARNMGKLLIVDLALVPEGWSMDKLMHFAKLNNIIVKDSFKEGNRGAATGKIAGGMNNASTGVVDAELGQSIVADINLLNFINNEMSQVVGISPQREGSIENRETVGGVERATIQSSLITDWIFLRHDDVRKRALECFMETGKIAMRGKSKKFEYILPDNSIDVINIEGDEFAECDYGLVVDCNNKAQLLDQQIEGLAQAGLQNQLLDFSTMLKLYNTTSLAEKIRMIEKAEKKMHEQQQQQAQQEQQIAQQQQEMAMQQAKMQMDFQKQMNDANNETRIKVAEIAAQTKYDTTQRDDPMQFEAELEEKKREFDLKQELEKQKLEMQERLDKMKAESDERMKREQTAANERIAKARNYSKNTNIKK